MKTPITRYLTTASSALALTAGIAMADQVILDDLIVQGSACIGVDCVNGENFGFDTIRLKENNLRIKFQDTSASASFPSTDWELQANESGNGGRNEFVIRDVTTDRDVAIFEGGAPNNALVVEDDGDIGIGLLDPVVDVHIRSGNSPTLRLEQDGSSGFTPQTWDLAGNEAGFFVRDVTNSSTLPFRILPAASSESLVIDGNDEVGIGAGTNPRAKLHVVGSGAAVAAPSASDDVIIQDAGAARLVLLNTTAATQAWTFNSNDTLRVSSGAGDPDFVLQPGGTLELGGACLEMNRNGGAARLACTFSAGGVNCVANTDC